MRKIKKFFRMLYALPAILTVLTASLITKAYADSNGSVIDTKAVSDTATQLKNAISAIAMPIGSVLIFGAVVMVAIKIIMTHNNPNKRSEAAGGLLWVAGGALILGLALMISGVIINIATNGTGTMR